MPYLSIRSYSVGRLTPSSSAVREMLPSVIASACWIACRSARVRTSLQIEQQLAVDAPRSSPRSSAVISGPSAMIIAVFTLFSSSRTLPGQEYASSAASRVFGEAALRPAVQRRRTCAASRAPARSAPPRRSRSGGTSIVTSPMRKYRSWRKRCSAISACRSRLVAQTTRTLTGISWRPPTRSITRFCRKRSSFACSDSGMSPISSRNSVPPSAISILPMRLLHRAGERALLVAEQLALEQLLGNRGAVDRDELAVLAAALRVHRAREQLLAGAALAQDQHRHVGRRDLLDHAAHLAASHRRWRSGLRTAR